MKALDKDQVARLLKRARGAGAPRLPLALGPRVVLTVHYVQHGDATDGYFVFKLVDDAFSALATVRSQVIETGGIELTIAMIQELYGEILEQRLVFCGARERLPDLLKNAKELA